MFDYFMCCNYYIDFLVMVIIYVFICEYVFMCENWWKIFNLDVFFNNVILNNMIR